MLKTVDVLIGLTVVMLLSSLIVTVLTQFITSALNSRGRHLLQGVSDLLQQVDPGMDREVAQKISAAVLTHPMIRAVGKRYGDVIHRNELTKILLELAADSGPAKLEAAARERLVQALKNTGISDPAASLQRVTEVMLDLETSRPELASNVRHGMALLQGAKSTFVAKMNAWFDQTMDRVSDRFTFTTRGITFAMGMLMAFAVQLDTPLLVNRLATDPQLRASLVEQAVSVDQQQHQFDKIPSDQRQQLFNKMASADLVSVPSDFTSWKANWSGAGLHPNPMGVLLSALLLSFGAPFWYSALKNLLQLRSILAQKDDVQRAQRQNPEASAEGT